MTESEKNKQVSVSNSGTIGFLAMISILVLTWLFVAGSVAVDEVSGFAWVFFFAAYAFRNKIG